MASRAAAEKIAIGGLKFALSQGVLVAIASYIARWHRLAQQARFHRVSRGVQYSFWCEWRGHHAHPDLQLCSFGWPVAIAGGVKWGESIPALGEPNKLYR